MSSPTHPDLPGAAAPEGRPAFPRPGSSLDHALRLTPPARRPALGLWLQWWHDISRIPHEVRDPGVAEAKLGWWLQEIAELAQGRARHPLTRGWVALGLGEADGVPMACWQQQVEGMMQLVHQTRWMDEAALQRHMLQTTGAAAEGAARLLGVRSEPGLAAARALGQGLRQAHQLARIGQDARAGWVMVGIDWLQRHEVRAHQLSKPERPMPAGWDALMAALHVRARDSLREALAQVNALPSAEANALRPLVYLAHTSLALNDAVRATGDTVLHQRVVLTPLRKGWLAQRARWGWLR